VNLPKDASRTESSIAAHMPGRLSVSEFYSRILMNILWRIAEISRPNAARRRQQAVRRRAHPGPQRHPGRNTAIDGMALAATIAA